MLPKMQTLVLPKHQVAKLESVVGKDWIYGEVPVNGTDKFTVTFRYYPSQWKEICKLISAR